MNLPKDSRTIIVGLFGLALSIRVVSLVALHWLAAPSGGPFLGLDSTTFLQRSQELAANGFAVSAHPISVFRDLGVGHYYLFAAAVRWLGAGLFGLQLLNCTLIALVAPLTYLWCRQVAPPVALWAGVTVALHPSLVTLGSLDLLKDPSVLFFTAVAIWALVRLVGSESGRAVATFGLVATTALLYLRLDRFYVAAYVEFAALAALLYLSLRGGKRTRAIAWLPAATLLGAVLLAEVVPVQLGWPSSPSLMARSVGWAMTVPQIRDYSPGLIDSPASDAQPESGLNDESSLRPSDVRIVFASLDSGTHVSAFQGESPRTAVRAADSLPRMVASLPPPLRFVVSSSVNTFRRLYGPFVWIMPDSWDVRTILTNDYPMYPGMLVWYAFFPMIAVGLFRTGWQIVTFKRLDFGMVLVWLFSCMLLGQYLVTNLAYRHRETMIPFLFVFGLLGMPSAWSRRLKTAYAIYWVALGAIAVGHLLLRAELE